MNVVVEITTRLVAAAIAIIDQCSHPSIRQGTQSESSESIEFELYHGALHEEALVSICWCVIVIVVVGILTGEKEWKRRRSGIEP